MPMSWILLQLKPLMQRRLHVHKLRWQLVVIVVHSDLCCRYTDCFVVITFSASKFGLAMLMSKMSKMILDEFLDSVVVGGCVVYGL